MATYTFVDGFLSVAGTDLSDHVQSMTLNEGIEAQDSSAMSVDTRSNIAGLKTWSLDVTFLQDFAASKVDATLSAVFGPNLTAALVIRPTSAAQGTTNPEWTGTGVLSSYNPIGGSVGDMATAQATFVAGGTLTRDAS